MAWAIALRAGLKVIGKLTAKYGGTAVLTGAMGWSIIESLQAKGMDKEDRKIAKAIEADVRNAVEQARTLDLLAGDIRLLAARHGVKAEDLRLLAKEHIGSNAKRTLNEAADKNEVTQRNYETQANVMENEAKANINLAQAGGGKNALEVTS